MKYIHTLIDYFFHHDVSEKLRRRVHHRMADGEHSDAVDEAFRALWDEAAHATDTPACQASARRVKGKIGLRTRPSVRMRRLLPYAALVLVCFLWVGSYVYTHRLSSLADSTHLMHIYVPQGTIRHFILPDSSEVWLNAGSTLVYAQSFGQGIRNVYLSGEGYFDVRHDSKRPFVVSGNHLETMVHGTEFNVQDYPNSQFSTATLQAGCIDVRTEGGGTFRLSPNEQVVYHNLNHTGEVKEVNANDYTAWRHKVLYFEDVTLHDLLKTLERTYQVKVNIQDSSCINQKIRVHFNENESIDTILYVIKGLIPNLNYRLDHDTIYIF